MTESMAVPGPVDRESFHDAQMRRRRASGWFTALSALALGVMGIPLAAVVSPLLYALAIVVTDVVNLVVVLPDPLAFAAGEGAITPEGYVVIAVALVVPGSVLMLATWLGLRRMFRDAGSGTAVLALGAREPSGEIEERQLVNVAGEMAAAAGIPAPRVMVIDSDVPNAAAVGARIDDATVVVTTGLLRTLDRAETQAVLGHLVGSVGNGDLRIGTTLASVFQTLGLVDNVLRAPTENKPRTRLRRLLRYAFRRPGADSTATVAALLAQAGTQYEADVMPKDPNPFTAVLMLPFVMAGGVFTITRLIFGFVVVNPLLRRAWRARKQLADATAVQLTRDPDALARALAKLRASGGVVPGAEWAAHLFVTGPETQGPKDPDTLSFNAPVPARIDRLRAMGADDVASRRTYSRGQQWMLRLLVVVTSPCWLSFGLVLLGCAVVLTLASLMIDLLFLAPVVALIHALLR